MFCKFELERASPAPATLRAAAPASGVMVNKTALIVSFLSVITLGGVTNKFAYQIKDVGDPAYPAHFFKKPWFLELLMFIGMTLSFPLYWAVESFSKPSKVANGTHSELLLTEEVKDRGWKVRALIFLPAMGDLVGSILSFTGLVYISNWAVWNSLLYVFVVASLLGKGYPDSPIDQILFWVV